jgi:hypothetical protein
MTRAFRAGLVYFALVFAAGFVLGAIRQLWIVPRVGTRAAELLEIPVMLVVSFLAARVVVRRFDLGALRLRFAAGLAGLVLLVVAELALVVFLQRATIPDYVRSRDPISGSAYVLSLVVFALLPALLGGGGLSEASGARAGRGPSAPGSARDR